MKTKMPSSVFRFKKFEVEQGRCAMKVNTDGVLLGAWKNKGDATHILDIGTGTGVIALMMAQGNEGAQIDAIDIDEEAWRQAKENFGHSPWAERLTAFHSSLQNFLPNRKYDLIISNPPYFVNDFKSHRHQRNVARHGIELDYDDLLIGIKHLLSEEGKALLILPVANFPLFREKTTLRGLFVTTTTEVVAVKGMDPYVLMIQVERINSGTEKSTITIKKEDNTFTEAYKQLTRDFYLNF
ncbi:MAG: methyltransferase [Bacteroidetes bacterium]|nr:methyltransferase [Bacteroidota bacterium]